MKIVRTLCSKKSKPEEKFTLGSLEFGVIFQRPQTGYNGIYMKVDIPSLNTSAYRSSYIRLSDGRHFLAPKSVAVTPLPNATLVTHPEEDEA